jgi:uncharacterized protein (DUF1684 family)
MKARRLFVVCSVLMVSLAAGVAARQSYDRAPLLKFRADRETALKADNGWLTVAGLHFLNQGENRVGSDPSNDIVLDFPSVPKHAGVITLNGTNARITAADGITLTINDKPVKESELHGAFDNKPVDTIKFGSVTFFVHYSGPRLAVRVRDQQSPIRTGFTGLNWFEPNPAFRAIGTFTPYAEPRTVEIPNILGDLEPFKAVGTVTFPLNGSSQTMEAWKSGERLWFVFRDLTSGKDSNASQRFLYVDGPKDGQVVMDFNFTQNPPCAYNPYTTCPLPPKQNRLAIPIAAGEKKYRATS